MSTKSTQPTQPTKSTKLKSAPSLLVLSAVVPLTALALLVAWGCGANGSISNTRSAEVDDDVLSIVSRSSDPATATDMETVPRDTFGKTVSIDGLIFPGADGETRSRAAHGLAIFTADRKDNRDGQGPYFNQVNCVGCHQATGGGNLTPSPITRSKTKDAFLIFGNFNPLSQAFDSPAALGGPVLHKRSLEGFPIQQIPPLPGQPFQRTIGLRAGPPYIGRGLMEAVFDGDIIANKSPALSALYDANGNVIYTIENRSNAFGQITGADNVVRLSRFGLRAGGPTLLQFALGNGPIGLSSPFSPGLNTPSGQGDVHPSNDLSADDLRDIRTMIRMMAPPARIPIVPGSVEAQGEVLFGADLSNVATPGATLEQRRGMLPAALRDTRTGAMNCVGCHMPVQLTGHSPSQFGNNLLSNRRAYLFSDLLIHNMGTGLATASLDPVAYTADANDLLPSQSKQTITLQNLGLDLFGKSPTFPIADNALPAQGRATQFHWRTPTLMGISLIGPPYMHDARVLEGQSVESGLDQAIRLHAAIGLAIPQSDADLDPQSEAYLTVRNYLALPQADKDALIAYLKTL